MPVKSSKKIVSKKKRKEIHDAVGSIPGLIIEHVAFSENSQKSEDTGNDRPNKKYMLSAQKYNEQRKKQRTVFIGVAIVILALATLWILNIKTFLFDSKNTISVEEKILKTVKDDFKSTVGSVSDQRPSITSSTNEEIQTANLQAALMAGLATMNTNTSTSSTIDITTSTTSTLPAPTSSSTP